MIYYYISFGVIVVAVLVILVIIIRKFPQLAAMNVESIPEEKALRLKNKIIIERLTRRFLDAQKRTRTYLKPVFEKTKLGVQNLYQRAMELEQEVRQQKQPLKSFEIRNEISRHLEEAEKLVEEEEYDKAEEVYITILSLDAKNIAAYEGLTELYIENRDYKKARETARYLIKLLTKQEISGADKIHLSTAYFDLGEIYELENKQPQALTNYKKAVDLEPNNPRYLDSLLKISILVKDKELAWRTFNALQEADPENKKLPDLKTEIESLGA